MKKIFISIIAIFISGICLLGTVNSSNKLLLDHNCVGCESNTNNSPVLILKTKKNWEVKAEKFINKYISKDAKGMSIVIGIGIVAVILLFMFMNKKDRQL